MTIVKGLLLLVWAGAWVLATDQYRRAWTQDNPSIRSMMKYLYKSMTVSVLGTLLLWFAVNNAPLFVWWAFLIVFIIHVAGLFVKKGLYLNPMQRRVMRIMYGCQLFAVWTVNLYTIGQNLHTLRYIVIECLNNLANLILLLYGIVAWPVISVFTTDLPGIVAASVFAVAGLWYLYKGLRKPPLCWGGVIDATITHSYLRAAILMFALSTLAVQFTSSFCCSPIWWSIGVIVAFGFLLLLLLFYSEDEAYTSRFWYYAAKTFNIFMVGVVIFALVLEIMIFM